MTTFSNRLEIDFYFMINPFICLGGGVNILLLFYIKAKFRVVLNQTESAYVEIFQTNEL